MTSESPNVGENESAEVFCLRHIAAFKKKADHNKSESLACFIIVIVATLVSPLFITLGVGIVWGKILPSLLSLLAAASTAWLQLRKPQQLWVLYRSAQRNLEDNWNRYRYVLDIYASPDRDKLLAAATADIAIDMHRKWVPLVPGPESLKKVVDGPPLKSLKRTKDAST